ncbi:hypothetical protein INR49_002247 [Caranx melampygus]|nr:hypothetical protein INR49_002247 [Caranx melampygus]
MAANPPTPFSSSSSLFLPSGPQIPAPNTRPCIPSLEQIVLGAYEISSTCDADGFSDDMVVGIDVVPPPLGSSPRVALRQGGGERGNRMRTME